jgi:ribosomal subunit interface protein
MRVIVKGRHFNLTPAVKEHAEEKLGKTLMKIFDRPAAKIEIDLGFLGENKGEKTHECHVSVFMPHGRPINIREVDDNIYKAIDLARDRLIEQVKREQGRKRHTSRIRKEAAQMRDDTAKSQLTVKPEAWEEEVAEYEHSL